MKQAIPFLLAAFFCTQFACNHKPDAAKVNDPELLSWFPSTATADTLRFEVQTGGDADTTKIIPIRLLFSSLDTALQRQFEAVTDTTEAVVVGKSRYVLNENFDACLLEVHQFWFRFQMLLLYDKQHHAFTDLVNVAQWYGGDGGQILTGSWLFDYDGDGEKDLVLRQIEHSMRVSEEGEPIESTVENGSLLLWKNGKFVESPSANSAELVKRFPIGAPW